VTEQDLLETLRDHPEGVQFDDIMQVINENYLYTPTRFTNGNGESMVINKAGNNEGSCKIFAFALLQHLSKQQTLHCFGDFYRKDVLEHPGGTDHANIRHFMQSGWAGIKFDTPALQVRV
jgi:hypothetical protein